MENSTSKIRVRFAPSPTGFVHVGSLRTALFNFLYARHTGGTMILRVEDTDQNRLVEGAVENLLTVMHKVGIDFDEGPYLENGELKQRGEFGSYIQSERKAEGIYKKYTDQLISEKKAYYCFCTEQRLDELRKEQTALKKPPMYDRHCRNLSEEEIAKQQAEFQAAGKNPVVRFAMPDDGQTVIHDLIYGDITYEHKLLDDQVILKSDGFPTYHLAVVVDDHFMQITHVIRGDEWIPSTPKHILLYKAFGWEPTQYGHLPLVLNPDKTKLSKRQGDVAVEDFLTKGYLPEALVNFVAFLGWNPKTDQEIFSMKELAEQFDLPKVNNAPSVFDQNKLDWMNAQYLRAKSADELVDLLIPHWKISGVEIEKFNRDYLKSIVGLEQERLKKLSEIGERTAYFFSRPEYDSSILTWKKSTPEDAKIKLQGLHDLLTNVEDFSKENLEVVIQTYIDNNGGDKGSVLWPLRAALTGAEKSPGPFEVASTLAVGLGKEEVLERIITAIAKL